MTFKTPDIFWQPWEVPVSNSIGDAVNDSRTKSISIVRVLNLKFNLYKTSFASCSSYKYISFGTWHAVTDVAFTTQRIGKDIRASSYCWLEGRSMQFLRLASLAISELATLDLSLIAVALTPSWLVWIITVLPHWLYFLSLLFCSVMFLNSNFKYYTC